MNSTQHSQIYFANVHWTWREKFRHLFWIVFLYIITTHLKIFYHTSKFTYGGGSSLILFAGTFEGVLAGVFADFEGGFFFSEFGTFTSAVLVGEWGTLGSWRDAVTDMDISLWSSSFLLRGFFTPQPMLRRIFVNLVETLIFHSCMFPTDKQYQQYTHWLFKVNCQIQVFILLH